MGNGGYWWSSTFSLPLFDSCLRTMALSVMVWPYSCFQIRPSSRAPTLCLRTVTYKIRNPLQWLKSSAKKFTPTSLKSTKKLLYAFVPSRCRTIPLLFESWYSLKGDRGKMETPVSYLCHKTVMILNFTFWLQKWLTSKRLMAASLSWSSCKLSSSSAYICVWNPVAFGSIWNASSPPPSDRTTVTVSRNHSKKKTSTDMDHSLLDTKDFRGTKELDREWGKNYLKEVAVARRTDCAPSSLLPSPAPPPTAESFGTGSTRPWIRSSAFPGTSSSFSVVKKRS